MGDERKLSSDGRLRRADPIRRSASDAGETPVSQPDGATRELVVGLLVEDGPLTAGEIADQLGISAAGVRRHLDALEAAGDVRPVSGGFGQRGRGRPAKRFQLTGAGRGKLRHAYDDLARAALRALRSAGGDAAVEAFARDRIEQMVAEITPADGPDEVPDTVEAIAEALTGAGFSANTRQVGAGMQICQHHCPVADAATEFPELCEAETAVFTELLGTHVQRLATIANGDCVCTTHVPLPLTIDRAPPGEPPPRAQPGARTSGPDESHEDQRRATKTQMQATKTQPTSAPPQTTRKASR